MWFGFGLLPKVLIAFLIAFFPVVISTAVGLASIEPEKIHLARSMGLSATATFFKIRLPNALPSIFAGLKISITLAVVGAVVGEFVGGDAGLGYLLMVANGSMDTTLLFAGLVALTIQGVVLYALVELAEHLAIPRRAATNAAMGPLPRPLTTRWPVSSLSVASIVVSPDSGAVESIGCPISDTGLTGFRYVDSKADQI